MNFRIFVINPSKGRMRYKLIPASVLLMCITSCGSHKASQKTSSTRVEKGPEIEHELKGPEKSPWEKTDVKTRNQSLSDFVKDWEGTPHRMGGNTKKGVDCSGFVIQAYLQVYDEEFISRRAEDIFGETKPVKREKLQEGDLVFFKISGRRISHVGIYLADDNFAHTSSSRGVMVSNLNEAYWDKRFFMGGRK